VTIRLKMFQLSEITMLTATRILMTSAHTFKLTYWSTPKGLHYRYSNVGMDRVWVPIKWNNANEYWYPYFVVFGN